MGSCGYALQLTRQEGLVLRQGARPGELFAGQPEQPLGMPCQEGSEEGRGPAQGRQDSQDPLSPDAAIGANGLDQLVQVVEVAALAPRQIEMPFEPFGPERRGGLSGVPRPRRP